MVKYIQNYALYESIGSGVYGKVYRAINNNDRKQYAIKVIPIAKFKQNKKLQQCTVNEINILTNIEAHPNIIKYYDMLKTTNNFYFIYQYCNGGTLQNLLSKQGKLNDSQTLLIFKQLLEAFQVLNKYNIMHRDMKPDNIFFHNGVIKLGDFGFCKNLNSQQEMTRTMLGSPIYMAPQVLKGEIYSNKADIWSLGVVLFEMVFGMCPFQSNSIANLIEVLNSKELSFPSQSSSFMKNLITRMLTKDPLRRISWMELFQIKINSQGEVESQKVIPRISSLNEAKSYDENQGIIQSNKNILMNDKKIDEEVPQRGDFKKNRSSNGQQIIQSIPSANSINVANSPTIVSSGSGYVSSQNVVQPQQFSVTQVPAQSKQLPGRDAIYSMSSPMNDNQSVSTNSSSPSLSSKPYIINSSNPNIPQKDYRPEIDHKIVMEGIRIAMDIIDNKLPNHLGYGHLLMTKAISFLGEILQKTIKKELADIFEKQIKELEGQREMIASKMYAYELKGLQDWKKYLRGKFFEEENTIVLWFKMVTFLNGTYGGSPPPQNSCGEIVKQILY